MDREGYRANAGDRCFHCKAELLDVLGPLAAEHGLAHVATGTNADDAVAGFRPGIRAAAERGAVTPLLDAGLTLSEDLWTEAAEELGWTERIDRYILHQVSQVHTDAICDRLGLEPDRVPRSFPEYGNIGPVSVPFTLAGEVDSLARGDRVLLMGIGSGLNASVLEIAW